MSDTTGAALDACRRAAEGIAFGPGRVLRRWRSRRAPEATRAMLAQFGHRGSAVRFFAHARREPGLLHRIPASTDLVFDVGGYVGEWAAAVAPRIDVPIHVFEPSPWVDDRLSRAVAGFPHVTVHHHGLAGSDATAVLSRIGPGSTVYDDAGDWERAEVELRDVHSVLASFAFSNATLKVNIEGGEYELFERLLETDHLAHIDTIYIQFHDWLPRARARRQAIRRGLRRTHRVEWSYAWVWEKWSRR